MKKIMKCARCGRYTLKESCPICKSSTRDVVPPKFSPLDPYGEYRRKAKKAGMWK